MTHEPGERQRAVKSFGEAGLTSPAPMGVPDPPILAGRVLAVSVQKSKNLRRDRLRVL